MSDGKKRVKMSETINVFGKAEGRGSGRGKVKNKTMRQTCRYPLNQETCHRTSMFWPPIFSVFQVFVLGLILLKSGTG
jgi:hypothetical protein